MAVVSSIYRYPIKGLSAQPVHAITLEAGRPFPSDRILGGAAMRLDRRNGRCGATNVDPQTGRRDRDLPAALRAAFGHKDLGVYLVTEQDGPVTVGDAADMMQGAAGGSVAAGSNAASGEAFGRHETHHHHCRPPPPCSLRHDPAGRLARPCADRGCTESSQRVRR